MVRAWPRLSNWLDDDVEGQRILRHLTASADAWQAMGRPDSESYRGARLITVLEWQRAATPDLTAAESAFLQTSVAVRDQERLAAAAQQHHQARTRRRTRLLISGIAALLVAVVLAGVLAVRQEREREAADIAADVAEATRLDDASRTTQDVDHALLLAMEAHRVHDSPESRSVIADLLSENSALIRSMSMPDAVQALAVSPDGTTLLTGEGNGGTSAYRVGTLEKTASYPTIAGWTFDYRADGEQLLFAGRGSWGLGEPGKALSAAVTDSRISFLQRLQVDSISGELVYAVDAAYSGNGRTLAVAALGYDANYHLIDSAVLVWDATSPDRPVLTIKPMPAFGVALSSDGRTLYVAGREPALTAVDVQTGRTVNSVPLPGAMALQPRPADILSHQTVWDALADDLEISPDGATLAVAEGNDVVLYDSMSLTERKRFRGHSDVVRTLQFSHNGELLASGSADHTAIVWDLATGGMVEKLSGHSGAVLSLAFARDDGTLFTGGLDRHLLVWDLTGRRRFIARLVDGMPHSTLAGAAVPSRDGNAVVYAGAAVAGSNLQFLDIPSGKLAEPIADPHGAPLAVWLPSESGQVATSAGRVLRVQDRGSNQTIKQATVAVSAITALAATANGGIVVVGEQAGGVDRIATGTLKPLGPRIQLGHKVTAVATGPADVAVAHSTTRLMQSWISPTEACFGEVSWESNRPLPRYHRTVAGWRSADRLARSACSTSIRRRG